MVIFMRRRYFLKRSIIIGSILAASLGMLTGCFLDDETETDTGTEAVSELDTETESVTEVQTTESESVAEDQTTVTDEAEVDSDRANVDTGTGSPKILQEGDTVPDFTCELSGGGTFHMSDYDDRVVILNFWATWCGPCVGEMPAFEKLKNDGNDKLAILCVNNMEDRKTVDSFVSDYGYTFNIGYDESGAINMYYPSDGIPYTLIINKGKIHKIFLGAYDADSQYIEYKNAIDECTDQ